MGLEFIALFAVLLLGFLFEVYNIHYDYHHPIAAFPIDNVPIDDYLDFIANKKVLVNGRTVIRCVDENDVYYILRLDLKNKNNIWRFAHMYGFRFLPFRIVANSILNTYGLIMFPIVMITTPSIVPISIIYQILEGFLDIVVALPMIFFGDVDMPPTLDVEPFVRFVDGLSRSSMFARTHSSQSRYQPIFE